MCKTIKHETFSHCWFSVGPLSVTLAHHLTNNGEAVNCLLDGVISKVYMINKSMALKGLAQAKIIKKSVILFRVLNMTI